MAADRNQIEREKLTIQKMIGLYCRSHRHAGSRICGDCATILRYARERIDLCPYQGKAKPACGLCRTNCFTPALEREFAQIMRYAGPRMLLRHPALTLAHLWDAVRCQRGQPTGHDKP